MTDTSRPTKEITTPYGFLVVMKTYVTARETLPVYKDDTKSDTDRANEIADIAIVTINGEAVKASDVIMDWPLNDYTFILNEVKKIAGGDFITAK